MRCLQCNGAKPHPVVPTPQPDIVPEWTSTCGHISSTHVETDGIIKGGLDQFDCVPIKIILLFNSSATQV